MSDNRRMPLRSRLLLLGACIFGLVVATVAVNHRSLQRLAQMPERMDVVTSGRAMAVELALHLQRLVEVERAPNAAELAEMARLSERIEARYRTLIEGDAGRGLSALEDAAARAGVNASSQQWQSTVKPALQRYLAERASALASPRAAQELELAVRGLADAVANTVRAEREALNREIAFSQQLQYGFAALVLLALLVSALLLRGALRAITGTSATLAAASSELLAGSSQQASSAQEQAAAVAETMATVEQVAQTSDQAAQRARLMADSAQRAAAIARSGREAVAESVASMQRLDEQSQALAERVVELAERAQAIGEIIAAVNEISDQTNMLALNAGIEAARASERGSGFAVVAREIKELADQAKQSTQQVRQILGEVQRSTQGAVALAETSSKGAQATLGAIQRAGDTIASLAQTVDEALVVANQITASAAQQATGMSQVRQAMRDIDQATTQATAATRQAERAAEELSQLGGTLRQLVGG